MPIGKIWILVLVGLTASPALTIGEDISFVAKCEHWLFRAGIHRIGPVFDSYAERLRMASEVVFEGEVEPLTDDEIRLMLEAQSLAYVDPRAYYGFLSEYRGPTDQRAHRLQGAVNFMRFIKSPRNATYRTALEREKETSAVARLVLGIWEDLRSKGYRIKLVPNEGAVTTPPSHRDLTIKIDPILVIVRPWQSVLFDAVIGLHLLHLRHDNSDKFGLWAEAQLTEKLGFENPTDEHCEVMAAMSMMTALEHEMDFLRGLVTSKLRGEHPALHDRQSSRQAISARRFDVSDPRELVRRVESAGLEDGTLLDIARGVVREFRLINLRDVFHQAEVEDPIITEIISWAD